MAYLDETGVQALSNNIKNLSDQRYVKLDDLNWKVGTCSLTGSGSLIYAHLEYCPALKIAYLEFQINGYSETTDLILSVYSSDRDKLAMGYNGYNNVMQPVLLRYSHVTFPYLVGGTAMIKASFFFRYSMTEEDINQNQLSQELLTNDVETNATDTQVI